MQLINHHFSISLSLKCRQQQKYMGGLRLTLRRVQRISLYQPINQDFNLFPIYFCMYLYWRITSRILLDFSTESTPLLLLLLMPFYLYNHSKNKQLLILLTTGKKIHLESYCWSRIWPFSTHKASKNTQYIAILCSNNCTNKFAFILIIELIFELTLFWLLPVTASITIFVVFFQDIL